MSLCNENIFIWYSNPFNSTSFQYVASYSDLFSDVLGGEGVSYPDCVSQSMLFYPTTQARHFCVFI